ncbi:MAG: GntR family transcriptional regulator [Candidatus Dormibacteraceae bacterium]
MSPEIQQSLPKYIQIANHVREAIIRGDLKPGDEIPSERQIVEEWHVSRPTATRALAALRAEGIVEARQGSGTYVRDQLILNRRARDRYARSRATGRAYVDDEWSEIVSAELAKAPEVVADPLAVERGSLVIRRRRIVRDSSGPVEVSVSWFNGRLAQKAPRLLERSRIREGTLAYVESTTGRRGHVARDRFGVRLADVDEARELALDDSPAALLIVQHVTFDSAGVPIEFVEAAYPAGRWMFKQDYIIPD